MYEFGYNYVKPKYGENAKLCYMDTNSFIVCIKTEDIYSHIAKDVETRFDSWIRLPITKRKKEKIHWFNEKLISLVNNEENLLH